MKTLLFHIVCNCGLILLLPSMARAQTTTWQSSNPSIVSVNSSGVAKLETTNTEGVQFVTIRATTTQNGATVTSTKQIEVNPYYPNCNSPSVYVGGLWWAACNVGSSTAEGYGGYYYPDQNPCASAWRIPTPTECISLNSVSGNGVWGTLNDVLGRWYSGDGVTGSGLFFPAAGWEFGSYAAINGAYRTTGSCGRYTVF